VTCKIEDIFGIIDKNSDRRLQSSEYITQAVAVMKHKALEAIATNSVNDFEQDFGHLSVEIVHKNYEYLKRSGKSYFTNGFENLDTSSVKELVNLGKRLSKLVSEKPISVSDRAMANITLLFHKIDGNARCL